MIYGYTRVSTDKQDERRQVEDIAEWAKGRPVKMIRETGSGAKDRPGLEKMLRELREGDEVVVTEFSRLTRKGVPDLLRIAGAITDKGATLEEIASGMKYDNSAIGELLLAFTGAVDRMERERIGERTRSALRMKKEQGMKLGRPEGSKLEARKEEIEKYQKLGISKANIARLLGCSRSTLYDYLSKYGGKK